MRELGAIAARWPRAHGSDDDVTTVATSILEANLAALGAASGDAVARIRGARARRDVEFLETRDGVPTARLGVGAMSRLLASARRPLDEAARLIGTLDMRDAAVYVVAGFGMGYHVAELVRRLGRTGVVIVFEPDVELLRAVLERVDVSAWVRAGNVCVLTDADDGAAMGEALRGLEGLVGLGVTLVNHPASGPRLGMAGGRFQERFAGIVEAVKMTVITTLVQVRVTMRNLLQNADVYATTEGIAELAGCCAGRAGIVVSAGPSLQRNIELLTDPAVRERCVIVAVQTVLKTLLSRGIRPHFVTALDFSEINRRFYEGLTPRDVEGITLVVEPKVNPAVVVAWRSLGGRILCTGDGTLDLLLGEKLARPKGTLKQGATVAHLAYYLARHLGCDPVALVGQDLGFTDGQYYASGAAIHSVWAGELNEFKTLELMEWQRIVRMGAHLRRTTDSLGRPVFTDSQMHSYLAQFETDFRDDGQRGLTTIDATEGGVRKQGAAVMGLREFLAKHGRSAGPSVADLLGARSGAGVPGQKKAATLAALGKRVGEVRSQVRKVAEISKRTAETLTQMREHQSDGARVDRLIEKVHANAAEVESLKPAFNLTQLLGQATVFNRVRADRLIQLGEHASESERQGLQIQRDIENVQGLEKTANELGAMLDGCLEVLRGGERVTRDLPVNERELSARVPSAECRPPKVPSARTSVVTAVVPVDLELSGCGWKRPLEGSFAGWRSVLAATVDRLLACAELRDVTLLAREPARVRELLEPRQIESGRVRIEQAPAADARRARWIAAGRLWARACWRGGLGDLTCFDEVFDPRVCAAALARADADAALVVGPDWVAVDPGLCGEVIRRHREKPEVNRLAFTQAAPGLCGCVVGRGLAEELSREPGLAQMVFATIGGVLGYVPAAPLQDLIAHPICVPVVGVVRDCGLRLIADTDWMRGVLEKAVSRGGAEGAKETVEGVLRQLSSELDTGMEEVVVAGGAPEFEGCVGPVMAVTFGDGRWDPLSGDVFAQIGRARRAGVAGVHVRSALRGVSEQDLRRLCDGTVDVVSVDFGEGRDGERSCAAVERLLAMRRERVGDDGMAAPWIVPRLTRCDATYGMVEEFVNRWVMACGWAALDPLDAVRAGERIGPLALPASAAARMERARRVL